MSILKVQVEEICKHPAGKSTLICRTSLDYNENIIFPFENIMSSFRTLYPDKHLLFNFTIL